MEDGALTPQNSQLCSQAKNLGPTSATFPLSLGEIPYHHDLPWPLGDILTPSVEVCVQMPYEIVLHRSNWKTRQKFKGAFMETSERRTTQRYRLNLAVVLRRAPKVSESDILNGNTRNISTGGMYFTTDRHLAVNELVDFSLTFAGLAEGTIVVVSGRARVLRLESRRETISERVGVAAVIQDFQILRPDLVNQRN